MSLVCFLLHNITMIVRSIYLFGMSCAFLVEGLAFMSHNNFNFFAGLENETLDANSENTTSNQTFAVSDDFVLTNEGELFS